MNPYSLNVYLLASGSNALQVSGMRRMSSPTRHDPIPSDKLVINVHPGIREGLVLGRDHLLHALGAWTGPGDGGIVVGMVGAEELICQAQVSGVPELFEKAVNEDLVVFC